MGSKRALLKGGGIAIWMCLLIALPSAGLAQGPSDNLKAYLELAAPDIRAKTMEIVKGSMNFTEEEGKAFWPVYKKFEEEQGAITDRTVALMKDYRASVDSLTNEKAKELADRVFEINAKKLDVNKKYYGEFSKALPQVRVLQFFQLYHRIDTLVSLRIASILPMIGEDW
jgi:hypothetical protein